VDSVTKQTAHIDNIENHPWQLTTKAAVSAGVPAEALDDSDNDSDFEVPALVIGTGDED
jgi:hypothetical protein